MSSEKMEWIYKGVSGLVDKEEYLTGRRVDKTFEVAELEKEGTLQSDFHETEHRIPSLLESTGQLSKLNFESTLKEDPLQQIKRRQIDLIKEILNNPIKMKRIKHLLEESLQKEKEERRARKKERKRKKKEKKAKKKMKRENEFDGYERDRNIVRDNGKKFRDKSNDDIDHKSRSITNYKHRSTSNNADIERHEFRRVKRERTISSSTSSTNDEDRRRVKCETSFQNTSSRKHVKDSERGAHYNKQSSRKKPHIVSDGRKERKSRVVSSEDSDRYHRIKRERHVRSSSSERSERKSIHKSFHRERQLYDSPNKRSIKKSTSTRRHSSNRSPSSHRSSDSTGSSSSNSSYSSSDSSEHSRSKKYKRSSRKNSRG